MFLSAHFRGLPRTKQKLKQHLTFLWHTHNYMHVYCNNLTTTPKEKLSTSSTTITYHDPNSNGQKNSYIYTDTKTKTHFEERSSDILAPSPTHYYWQCTSLTCRKTEGHYPTKIKDHRCNGSDQPMVLLWSSKQNKCNHAPENDRFWCATPDILLGENSWGIYIYIYRSPWKRDREVNVKQHFQTWNSLRCCGHPGELDTALNSSLCRGLLSLPLEVNTALWSGPTIFTPTPASQGGQKKANAAKTL